MVQPSTVNMTEMNAQKWRDTLFLKYGLDFPDLPHYCNGLNAPFYIFHDLDCKRNGVFTCCHNKLRDGVVDLSVKYFTPSHVRDNPLIFLGCVVNRPKSNLDSTKSTTVPSNTPPLEAT